MKPLTRYALESYVQGRHERHARLRQSRTGQGRSKVPRYADAGVRAAVL
jgi:hypothetical protein